MKKILFSGILLAVSSIYASGQGNKEHTTIVNVKEKTTIEEFTPPPPTPRSCAPKNAFGLDVGIGGIRDKEGLGYEQGIPTFALGFRYLHHFFPYFGVDFFKFNNQVSYKDGFDDFPDQSYFGYNFQLMTGVRGNSPAFFKCMSGYVAFRLGYGVNYENISTDGYGYGYYYDSDTYTTSILGNGFCYELELGLNLTRNIFIGYAFNRQNGTRTVLDSDFDILVDAEYPVAVNYHSFRIGFNFGR